MFPGLCILVRLCRVGAKNGVGVTGGGVTGGDRCFSVVCCGSWRAIGAGMGEYLGNRTGSIPLDLGDSELEAPVIREPSESNLKLNGRVSAELGGVKWNGGRC